MYKNKSSNGTLNICGSNLATRRKKMIPKTSQRQLAEMLQLEGIDLDKNAIQRIECGKRFVTDIELKAFAKVFNDSVDFFLE